MFGLTRIAGLRASGDSPAWDLKTSGLAPFSGPGRHSDGSKEPLFHRLLARPRERLKQHVCRMKTSAPQKMEGSPPCPVSVSVTWEPMKRRVQPGPRMRVDPHAATELEIAFEMEGYSH